jgi:hypothetical protein
MKAATALPLILALASTLTAQNPSTVHICVAADGTMRIASGTTCPGGQTGYRVLLAGSLGNPPGDDKGSAAQVTDLKKTIDFLKDRVANLEHEMAVVAQVKAGGKVMAPFEVLDHSGRLIFRIRDDRHGFEMANPAGQIVLWASALDGGGVFKTHSAAGYPEAAMGSVGDLGGFVLRDGDNADRGSLTLSGGKTSLDLRNDSHINIASLHQGSTGGGALQLGAASGESAVQAGVTSGGKCGKVEALPRTNPGRQLVGAPASFILGGGC